MSLAAQRLHSRGRDCDRQLPALKETGGDVLVTRHDEAERNLVLELHALVPEPPLGDEWVAGERHLDGFKPSSLRLRVGVGNSWLGDRGR